jgi:hypothetical protein
MAEKMVEDLLGELISDPSENFTRRLLDKFRVSEIFIIYLKALGKLS